MQRDDRKVIGLLATAHAMVHIFEQAFPALLATLMAEFAFSLQAGGNMQFGLALAFGVGAIPAGMLAARLGARRVVQAYLVVAAAGAALMAYAPNTLVLALGLLGVGLGISLYHPAGTSFVATHVRARSKALGYHGMGGGFGVFVGPALTVTAAVLLGWRGAFALYAVVAVCLAVLIARLPDVRGPESAPTELNPDPAPRDRETEGRTHLPRLVLLYASAVMVGFVYRGMLTFLPLYMGLSLAGDRAPDRVAAVGGYVASGALLIGMGAQWLGGQLGERFSLTRLYAISHTLAVPCLLLLATVRGPMLAVAAGLFAVSHFLAQPVGNALVVSYASARIRDHAFGWYFALTFGIGAFAASLGGIVGARFALGTVFVMLAGVSGVAALGAWCLHVWPEPRAATVPQPVET